jgi:ribosome-binding protein aMBF1 (putative translation factor)
MSQDELSKAADVSVTAIHRLETGETKPRPSTTRKLANELGVRVQWLTVGEQPVSEKGQDS